MQTVSTGPYGTNNSPTVRGYNPAYGGVPVLPTGQQLQSNITGILNQAIPGFNGLTNSASSIIGDSMSGKLPTDVQNLISDRSATQAVASGMPGSSNTGNTLFGNRTLRDLGLTSLARKDQGVKDLIGLLQGFSGAATPTVGQLQDQDNSKAEFDSAPLPAEAAKEQERLYDKYSNPAAGTVGGGGGGEEGFWTDVYENGQRGRKFWSASGSGAFVPGGRA